MIRFPEMRQQLIFDLRALADTNYQQRVWVNFDLPKEPFMHDLSMVIHTIFDDLCLDEDIDRAIGSFIYQHEVQAIKDVVTILNKVLDAIDHSAPDIHSDDWKTVVKIARIAYSVLTDGEDPNGLYEEIQAR